MNVHIAAVLDSDLAPSLKLVAITYAIHADPDGRRVFPSLGLVAWRLGLTRRAVLVTVQRTLGPGARGLSRASSPALDPGASLVLASAACWRRCDSSSRARASMIDDSMKSGASPLRASRCPARNR